MDALIHSDVVSNLKDFVSLIGGVSVIIAACSFLAARIAEHFLSRKVEQYKISIQLNAERSKIAFALEKEKLEKLWGHIIKASDICGAFKGDENISYLENAINDLNKFMQENSPYIHPQIICLVNKFTEIAEPEQFNCNKFNEINNLKKSIIDAYHKRLLLVV